MANSKKQIEDFVIESGVKSVLERTHCEVKHGRTVKGFIEYVKYNALKIVEDAQQKVIDLDAMIVDYFSSEKEHNFEIKNRMEERRKQLKRIETEIARVGED